MHGKLTVVNSGEDRKKIAQCTGTLSGDFASMSLPNGYYVRKTSGKELWLIHWVGTCISVY